jgi:RIO-like serine/threonine protein kinase
MTSDEVYKLIEANGLTLHGDIEHFAALVKERTWVGLTDMDIALIDWESLVTRKDCVRAIEAKLKEKNT